MSSSFFLKTEGEITGKPANMEPKKQHKQIMEAQTEQRSTELK